MWAAIAQVWAFIGSLASAANNAATAIEKCTLVADQAADNFLAEESAKQAERKIILASRLAAIQAEHEAVA